MRRRVELDRRLGLGERQRDEPPEVELVRRREPERADDLGRRLPLVAVLVQVEELAPVGQALGERDVGVERAEGVLDERELGPPGPARSGILARFSCPSLLKVSARRCCAESIEGDARVRPKNTYTLPDRSSNVISHEAAVCGCFSGSEPLGVRRTLP